MVKGKREQSRYLALKAKKESSDEESSTSDGENKEYAMAVRDFKKFFKRRERCGDLNHLIGECPKSPRSKNQRDFVGGTWSDSSEDEEEKTKDETCLVAQESNEEIMWTEKSLVVFVHLWDVVTPWFSKKQTALAISTTEAEYISAGNA
ncbi:hypothetical protein Tco_0800105 [Tanacetum coccineum]|uniref:Alpha/beta hydrolases superfamily protein n=1 Tax=Tanacetum coccineum TaxID=301880 RepID=A0ABQ4ZT80_9ASTR